MQLDVACEALAVERRASSRDRAGVESGVRDVLRERAAATAVDRGMQLRIGQHPERGAIGPGEFIPVAESTGQIIELGEWVMGEVARHCQYWDTLGLNTFRVCVNISPLQFNQSNLPEWVADFLDRSGLPAKRLELELQPLFRLLQLSATMVKITPCLWLKTDLYLRKLQKN